MKRFLAVFSETDVRNIIAILFVGGCMFFILMLLVREVPEKNKDLVNVLGGNVIGLLGPVLGYFFGAAKKDNTKEDKI